ncbi:MAG: RNA polymerase sigma factor [Hyphomicrobiaceae bacterium]
MRSPRRATSRGCSEGLRVPSCVVSAVRFKPHETDIKRESSQKMTGKGPRFGPSEPESADSATGMNGVASRCEGEGQLVGPPPEFRDELLELLPRLRRFALSLAKNRDHADDLVQETVTRALAKFELWQPGSRLDSWLFRMMQNVWLDRVRAGRRNGSQVGVEEIVNLGGDDGRAVAESRLELTAVMAAMARLKPDHQVIISLVCIEGLAYREVADILGLPMGTVMSRLSRARLELHRFLDGASASTNKGLRRD